MASGQDTRMNYITYRLRASLKIHVIKNFFKISREDNNLENINRQDINKCKYCYKSFAKTKVVKTDNT